MVGDSRLNAATAPMLSMAVIKNKNIMKANEVNLNRFLAQTDTQFIIPVYQRNYDWTTAQCKQLLDDIISVGKIEDLTSHFIGSIVYIHDDIYSVSGIRELSIIDGQQRLTTVTLLYITIFSIAKELKDHKLMNRIQKTYLINEFAKEEEKLKLRPTENNDNALKYLLRNDPNDEFNEYSRLIENYNFFRSRITSENVEIVQKGLGKLLFVEISLERDKDDPQRIFESLNSTGLELSQSDLIRNYILMGLKYKNQINLYDNYWKIIETNSIQEESNTNKVSDFIRDFLTIESREIPNKNKVYQEFKRKYSLLDLETIEKILSKVKKYSLYYKKIINPQYENDTDVRTQLHFINRLEINVAYPFLLEVYNDFFNNVINKATFIEVLEIVQSFTWRRFVVSLPTNALNKIFMRLYEDIDHSDYVNSIQKALMKKKSTQRFPRDNEVLDILKSRDMYGIQSKNRNYFLEKLENHENREPVKIDGNSDITVEHVFPQNPDIKWKLELGELPYSEMKDKHLNTIANLTLSGNNGKLGNKYFTDKRDMNEEGKEQGYKFSRLWLNKYLTSLEKWTPVEIEQRFKLIADRFLKIWKLPDILDANNNESEEVNIFEADEPTHRRLDYVIFFDQKIEIRMISDLYCKIMSDLFILNPQTFFQEEIKEKLNFTKNKDECRTPFALNETYFIEQNLSSKLKFDKMKLVLSAMDLSDDLFIKYTDDK